MYFFFIRYLYTIMPDYSQITDRIFIGNSSAAKNKAFFKNNNIVAVLNCTTDIPNFFCEKLEYLRIPVEDSLKQRDFKLFYNYIPVMTEYIHKIVDIEKGNIFVHCWAGMQRSTGAVAAYMMKYQLKSLKTAVRFIHSKRKEAFHFGEHVNFDQALLKYERDLEKMKKCT
jgi:protein-tyrosine phosphatase